MRVPSPQKQKDLEKELPPTVAIVSPQKCPIHTSPYTGPIDTDDYIPDDHPLPPPPPPREAAPPPHIEKTNIYTAHPVQSSNSSAASYCSSSSSDSSTDFSSGDDDSGDESSGAFPIYTSRSRAGSSSDSSGAFPSALDDDDEDDDLLPITSPGVMIKLSPAASPAGGASPASHGRNSTEGKTPSPSVPSYRAQGRKINASPSASPVPSPAGSVKKVLFRKGGKNQRPNGGVGRTISADSSDDDIEEDRKSDRFRKQREEERISRLVVMAKQQQSFAQAWFQASASDEIQIIGPGGQIVQAVGSARKSRGERSVRSGGSSPRSRSSSRSPSPARSDISNSSTISTKSGGCPIDVDSGELWDSDSDDGDDEASTSSKKSLRRALTDILGRGAKVKNRDQMKEEPPDDDTGSFAAASLKSSLSSRSIRSSADSKKSKREHGVIIRSAVPVTRDVEKGVPPVGVFSEDGPLDLDDDSICDDNPHSKQRWIDRTVVVGCCKCTTFTLILLALATVIIVGVAAVVGIAVSDKNSGDGPQVAIMSSAGDADATLSSPSLSPTAKSSTSSVTESSAVPTAFPSAIPLSAPSAMLSAAPSMAPSFSPSAKLSKSTPASPSVNPSEAPTSRPSMMPTTQSPSASPTSLPSFLPSISTSAMPTGQPSNVPSNQPSSAPSSIPTTSMVPSASPSSLPTSFYRTQSYSKIGDIFSTSANEEIISSTMSDQTGKAVALSKDGTILAVGGDREDSRSGRVRVYKAVTSRRRNLRQELSGVNGIRSLSDVTWEPMGEPLAGRVKTDHFGVALSLSDDGMRLAVAEPGYDNPGKFNAGNVRVFDYNGTGWNLVGNEIQGEVQGDLFGSALAMSGDGRRVAIGAYLHDTDEHESAGHVKLYELIGNEWFDMGKPLNGTAPVEQFGWSVALNKDGSVVAVGAPRSHEGGYVQAFSWVDTRGKWEVQGPRMLNSGPNTQTDDRFGFSVSLSSDGSRCVVGAPLYDGAGILNGGIASVFEYTPPSELSNVTWDQIGGNILGDGSDQRQLGYSVSISPDGQYVAVGASGDDSTSGRVYVHRWDGYLWDYAQPILSEKLNDDFGEAVSLSSNGATVAVGSPIKSRGIGHGYASIYELDILKAR